MDESLAAQVANLQNVKWLDYTTNLMQTQKGLFESNSMSDVLIVVGPAQYKAHQVILTVCSDFFAEIFSTCTVAHSIPTVLIPDLHQNLMPLLLEFMYTGEVFVSSNYLSEFLEACRFLQIKGFVSYDCMVNGIRLQQDPTNANEFQTIVPEAITIEEPKETIIIPHTFDISDVIVNTEYPIKEFSIIEDVSLEMNKCIDSPSHTSTIEQSVPDTTIEEYLEEEEDPLIETTFTDDLDTFQPQTSTPCPKITQPPSGRTSKSYTESALSEAIEELRSGATVVDVAAKFDIPRSTIYSKLRHSKDPVYRTYRVSHLQEAAQCVAETGISLKEASQKFDVSKTVLWRTLKKSTYYKPEERTHASRSEALLAIQNGDTLVSISKRFNIPLATLHRDKVRLHKEGKLPEHCKLTRRDSGTNYRNRLRAAVESCISGMPQKMASELHKVPKTTIWRHVQLACRGTLGPGTAKSFECKVEDEDEVDDEEEKLEDDTMIDCEVEERLEDELGDDADEDADEDGPEFVLPYDEADEVSIAGFVQKEEENSDM